MFSASDDTQILIAYGLRGTQLLHITEVPRGLACACVCARCGDALVARQGTVRVAHFAHAQVSHCDGGIETILHRLAKELFVGIRELALPAYTLERRQDVGTETVSYSALVRPAKTVPISRVQVEPRLRYLVPDLIVCSGRHELIVEIAVAHRIDAEKRGELAKLGLPAVEIRLNASDATLSREALRRRLARDRSCKHWLFHPKERAHEERFHTLVREKTEQLAAAQAERARFLREGLSQAQKPRPAASSPHALPMKGFIEWERALEAYYRRHGRYPSLEESQRLRQGRRN